MLEWILVFAVLHWVAVPRELPWNSLSLWTPCTADCFHRPEESFSGPWCQDEGINCQPSVRFIEEWKRLCVISHARTSLTRSYRLILCASMCGWLLVSDWEDGKADRSIPTTGAFSLPWRTAAVESLSLSNLQQGTGISLLSKMKPSPESQRMGFIIIVTVLFIVLNRHWSSYYIQASSQAQLIIPLQPVLYSKENFQPRRFALDVKTA